jgi:hypothetical protein
MILTAFICDGTTMRSDRSFSHTTAKVCVLKLAIKIIHLNGSAALRLLVRHSFDIMKIHSARGEEKKSVGGVKGFMRKARAMEKGKNHTMIRWELQNRERIPYDELD